MAHKISLSVQRNSSIIIIGSVGAQSSNVLVTGGYDIGFNNAGLMRVMNVINVISVIRRNVANIL